MLRFPLAPVALFFLQFAVGAEVSVLLPLVSETGFNRFDVKLAARQGIISAEDTQQTNLSGVMEVRLQVDTLTGKVSAMAFEGGDVAFTDMTFNLKSGFFTVGTANSTGLVGSPSTPAPPAPVEVPSGELDAALHVFTIKRGTLIGSAAGTDSTTDFSTDPLAGALSGTGSVLLTELPGMETASTRTWSVAMVLPVNITESEMPDESTTLTTTVTGSLKGLANVTIGKTEFLAWTIGNGEGAPAFDAPLREGVPAGLVWALGGAPADTILSRLPVIMLGATDPMAMIDLSGGAIAAPVTVEVSEDLSSWRKASLFLLDTSANPLPSGFQGKVMVQLGDMERFVRLSAMEP